MPGLNTFESVPGVVNIVSNSVKPPSPDGSGSAFTYGRPNPDFAPGVANMASGNVLDTPNLVPGRVLDTPRRYVTHTQRAWSHPGGELDTPIWGCRGEGFSLSLRLKGVVNMVSGRVLDTPILVHGCVGHTRLSIREYVGPTQSSTRERVGHTQLGTIDCQFRGGLVFEAHRLLHHSASGSRTF